LSHYFSKNQSETQSKPKRVSFFIGNDRFEFTTDSGVFSKQGLDFGSRLLLESIETRPSDKVLDLGCGYGPIGIALQKKYQSMVWMSDVNQRALELTTMNAVHLKAAVQVIESDGFNSIDGLFDVIVSNPPIRAGKQVMYQLFRDAQKHLLEGGRFVIVIRKDQGAESAYKELLTYFQNVSIIAKKSGYFIIECQ
jgi:16S rRNA (guanine1207-N2)-methyltransferase